MKKIVLLTLLLLTPNASFGAGCNLNLSVNGLVCDFCAQSITALFKKRADVTDVKVDLDNGKVTINAINANKLDNETLKEIMTDAGYTLTNVERSCS